MPAHPILDHPFPLLVVSVAILFGAARLGIAIRHRDLDAEQREDFGIILGATLTLLGLIIGFSFSMASSRYDQRKGLEEAEANAIGTEYVRAELLPLADQANVKSLLRAYTGQRIAFYTAPENSDRLQAIDAQTSRLQNALWAAVRAPSVAKPTPVNALVLNGMNDVLNSQGYTQAAWWNRIPAAAWLLMAIIAIAANVLGGFGSHRKKSEWIALVILPVLASVAFLLIADLDSPRGGVIHVSPQNLVSLSKSFGGL